MGRLGTGKPEAERFWALVKKTRGCWLWLGAKNRKGYGRFSRTSEHSPRKAIAHRVSFELAHGHSPPRMVLHKCHNPSCVRPDHIYDGDAKQNAHDRDTKMTSMALPGQRVVEFVSFIKARERHRLAKETGMKIVRPDSIIAKYRFCNVRRNNDRVTKEIHAFAFETMGWREAPELWFAFVVARLFNNEETLLAISDNILPFKPIPMARILHARAKAGRKNFNAAYIVSTNGRAMNKIDYVIQHVLTPMWKHRAHLSHFINKQELLGPVHEILGDQMGFASFMAAQVVADLKYANPNKWSDFHTFVASGPGSRRGLNRLLNRDKDAPMPEAAFRATLLLLRDSVNARLTGWEAITAQDIQNCLCEFDKHQRALTGDGEPKQLYKPKEK